MRKRWRPSHPSAGPARPYPHERLGEGLLAGEGVVGEVHRLVLGEDPVGGAGDTGNTDFIDDAV